MSENPPARYELLYIIPTTFTDEEVGNVEQKITALLEKIGASIESTQRLGKLRFAYPIKKQRHGHYVLVYFTLDRLKLAKIEENLRITPEVLRHLIVRVEGEAPKFNLVPYEEVNIEAKEENARRRKMEAKKKAEEDSAQTEKAPADSTEAGEAKPKLSEEEVEKTIASALKEDQVDV